MITNSANVRRQSQAEHRRSGAEIRWWLGEDIPEASVRGVYIPYLAASYEQAKLNLNNPGTSDLIDLVSPNWSTENGFMFTGSQYLDTGISPATNQSYSMLCWFTNANSDTGAVVCGCNSRDGYKTNFSLIPRSKSGTSAAYLGYNGGGVSVGVRLNTGFLGMGGNYMYLNGSPVGGPCVRWTQSYSYSVYIGANHHEGTDISAPFIGYVRAVLIYSISLSAARVQAIYQKRNLVYGL